MNKKQLKKLARDCNIIANQFEKDEKIKYDTLKKFKLI